MKNFLALLIILAAISYGWWSHRGQQKGAALLSASAAPVAQAKHFAPPGVFYVLERISKATSSGVISVTPGTEVTLVRAGSPMRITDGAHEFDVLPSQLTNDVDLGEQLARKDHAAQATLAPMIPQPSAGSRNVPPTAQTAAAAQSPETAVGNTNPTEAARQQKIALIRQKIEDAQKAIQDYQLPAGRKGRVLTTDKDAKQRFIDQKNQEISGLKGELQKLGVAF